ncbi:hypothetical protein [Mesorhizobium sp. B2-3-5]|uniref:hypothetical protein n=1 Tax=Mesorhizobium sp. B2-3-5 TaxID=2589958 RepID=UPI0011270ADC|nr:hypothetical protein [Mesorhizobium sp. B2-3-5]TPM36073.1 hypothetical protein FJ958_04270 [Mesorhizobium sp. B2-3-5]
MQHRLNRLIISIAVTAATSSAAFAGDNSSPAQTGALPGVAADYRIAKPTPVPEPDAFPSDGNGQFRIGDTDVRISGSITVDVGTGGIKSPR